MDLRKYCNIPWAFCHIGLNCITNLCLRKGCGNQKHSNCSFDKTTVKMFSSKSLSLRIILILFPQLPWSPACFTASPVVICFFIFFFFSRDYMLYPRVPFCLYKGWFLYSQPVALLGGGVGGAVRTWVPLTTGVTPSWGWQKPWLPFAGFFQPETEPQHHGRACVLLLLLLLSVSLLPELVMIDSAPGRCGCTLTSPLQLPPGCPLYLSRLIWCGNGRGSGCWLAMGDY